VELSDGAVVRRVLDGDAELFGVLVERYREKFGRYATSLVGDGDAAADAMQDAFIRAYDSLDRCREPDRFGSWFFRILTNQCHDTRDRLRAHADLSEIAAASQEQTDADVERGELSAIIAKALDELTAEQREAFVMKHVDGRSYEEMAELTGTGVDALKMRVHRARDSLRAKLEERL
jgi:RNA polymerase sigma-70 factor (ECF subfamily)